MVCWETTDLGEVLGRFCESADLHEPARRLDCAEGERKDDDGEVDVQEVGYDPGIGQLSSNLVNLSILHEPL